MKKTKILCRSNQCPGQDPNSALTGQKHASISFDP